MAFLFTFGILLMVHAACQYTHWHLEQLPWCDSLLQHNQYRFLLLAHCSLQVDFTSALYKQAWPLLWLAVFLADRERFTHTLNHDQVQRKWCDHNPIRVLCCIVFCCKWILLNEFCWGALTLWQKKAHEWGKFHGADAKENVCQNKELCWR